MFRTNDRNYLYLVTLYIVLTISYLVSEFIITGRQFGVPLDDTWIHFRFAENFAHGHFFEYNIGEPTPGTTSPFWVIVLSIPFLISPRLILLFSLIAGSVFFLLTGLETYRLGKRLGFNDSYAFFIAVLTLFAGRLAWSSLSGMEITFFTYLTVIIIKIHLGELEQNKISIVTGLLLGLAVITRPEAYLLALIYYVLTVILLRKSIKKNIAHLVLSIMVFALIIIPYPLFCYQLTGKFLPSTFEGQNAAFNFLPNITFLVETGKLFVRDNVIIFLLWLWASVYFIVNLVKRKADSKFILIYLWVILLPVVSSFVAPNWRHHGRYLIPIIPFINIVSIDILQKSGRYIQEKYTKFSKFAFEITPVVLMFFSITGTIIFALSLGWNVENINDQQVKIGRWINRSLQDEKVLGMNDIGAITFVTKKRIVDMEGLVTPEIFKLRKLSIEQSNKALLKLLKQNNVNYIIIYPGWYDYLMEHYSGALESVYSAKLEHNTICGGPEMFVYKIHWDKLNLD